jgi:phosphate transport system substrate-binding protein
MKKSTKVLSLLILLAVAAIFMTSCGGGGKENVIIAGSTSVQPFIQALSEEYADLFPHIAVNVQGGGSSAGITAARTNTADVGMSSRSLRPAEVEEMDYIIIARDGLALIVHPSNPISDLTIEQVRDIYNGKIYDWSYISGSSLDGRIHVISREAGSGTREVFENTIMALRNEEGEIIDRERISDRAMIQSTNGTIKQLVAGDKHSIGFISLGMIDDSVKGVHLNGVAPTVENVNNNSYTFYRPFLFVLNPQTEQSQATYDFISFVMDPRGGQLSLAREGLVPAVVVSEGTGEN